MGGSEGGEAGEGPHGQPCHNQQPPVFQVLLLALLGAQGQGGTPSPKCDCASNFQKRSGLFCCKGCPAGEQPKGWEGCGGEVRADRGRWGSGGVRRQGRWAGLGRK